MNQHNGQTLAYLGDACFELAIRDYLLARGWTKVNDLHRQAVRYTSAMGQALAMARLLETELNETEIAVFKRGRNAEATRKPKNVTLSTYHQATGFEALLGHLYLEKNHGRLEEIIAFAIRAIEENPD